VGSVDRLASSLRPPPFLPPPSLRRASALGCATLATMSGGDFPTVLISCYEAVHPAPPTNLLPLLQSPDAAVKADGLRQVIAAAVGADGYASVASLFIPIVRYCLPCADHHVQKLLLIYLARREIKAQAPPERLAARLASAFLRHSVEPRSS